MQPVIVARPSGGYLATSPDTLPIGVVGANEKEVRSRFDAECEAWASLIETPRGGHLDA
jgi:hypothetical protein